MTYKPYYVLYNGIHLIFPSSRKFKSIEEIQRIIPHLIGPRYLAITPFKTRIQISTHNDIVILDNGDNGIVSILKKNTTKWINLC